MRYLQYKCFLLRFFCRKNKSDDDDDDDDEDEDDDDEETGGEKEDSTGEANNSNSIIRPTVTWKDEEDGIQDHEAARRLAPERNMP